MTVRHTLQPLAAGGWQTHTDDRGLRCIHGKCLRSVTSVRIVNYCKWEIPGSAG
jgi:hypothetical protein